MKWSVVVGIIGAVCLTLSSMPANAQATRTWVSGVGDDANPCSRTAPCKTFAGAISKTATNGEIDNLDAGGFGAVTITKSITIDGSGGGIGGVLVASTNGIIVSVPAGSNVTLRNLDFEGSQSGLSGITVTQGGAVHVQHVVIRDFVTNGIAFTPNTAGAQLTVDDAIITDSNGGTAGNAGILVRPTGSGNASVTIGNTRIAHCLNGIFADGSGGGGVAHVQVTNSIITDSGNTGMAVSSTASAVNADVFNTLISYSLTAGAGVAGSAASLKLGGNIITNNITGVASSGGTLQSFKNNQITDNGTDGTPITAVPGYSGTLQ
jgi:hypothetical protein